MAARIAGRDLTTTSDDLVKAQIDKLKPQEKTSLFGGLVDLFRPQSDEKTASTYFLEQNKEWVYRNNDVIAKEVARINFKLYKVNVGGEQIVLDEITSHELLDLLDKFNDVTTKANGFYQTQSHRKIVGDAFWVLQGTQPEAAYVLNPTKVELKLGQFKREGFTLVEGYVYKDTINGKRVEVTYKPDEILHFKVPNPKNPYRGLGVVEAAAATIDLDNLTAEVNLRFFKQGALTNFVLSTDKKISPDDRKRLRAELNANYGGFKNAFKAMILGGGLKPESIRMSNKDMEFLAQMEWYRDKLMVLFGNNKAVLGITEDVNRANADATINHWKSNTVQAEMADICDTINEFLVPRFGENLIMGFEPIVSEDRQKIVEEVVQLKNAKIMTKNEARERLEMDPVDGGDEFEQDQPLVINPEDEKTIPKTLKFINYKRYLRRMKAPEKVLVNKKQNDVQRTAKALARAIIKKNQKKIKFTSPSFDMTRVEDYYWKLIHVVDQQEQRVEKTARQLTESLVEEALANIDNEQARKGALADEKAFMSRAEAKMTPVLTEVLVASGNEANRLIGVEVPYIPKAQKDFSAREFIRSQILLFAASMYQTDIEYMVGVIADGLTSGASIPKIKRTIREAFFGEGKRANIQAERIARTETIKAANAGTQDAFLQSGVVEGKQWLAELSDRTDPECAALDGEIVDITGNYDDLLSQKFGSDRAKKLLAYSGSMPYPPLHANCRCTLIPVLIGEKSQARALYQRVKELESQIDKRTREFKQLKAKNLDTPQYAAELERILSS